MTREDGLRTRRRLTGTTALAAAALALVTLAGGVARADTTLTIESWRNDDSDIWNSKILPAFMAKHPDIKVTFKGYPPTEYNAALNTELAGGTAADIITCRPFDASLDLFKKGNLLAVDDIKGIENFSDVAKSAWQTDDGKTTFCMPMASVIHGFIYNKKIFDELGLTPPKTMTEFHALLDKIKANGKYTPIALGTAEQWEAATMGFQNIGPDYWNGEAGRKALIDGSQKFTDAPYVAVWKEMASWAPYMGNGYQAQKYADTQNLFSLGRAAIYPAGSWDIPLFEQQSDFKFDAFPPPQPDGTTKCYISDHTDIAMGINAKSKNLDAAKTFIGWVASAEFAGLYANSLPGFFPLTKEHVDIQDPVAQTFVGWRKNCESTIRNSYQILSRGTPNLENELWAVSANVLNGTQTPEAAAKQIEDGLKGWYKPHQN
jgi:raffinose/stachyose/melibiose transport system substrate-binding protein